MQFDCMHHTQDTQGQVSTPLYGTIHDGELDRFYAKA